MIWHESNTKETNHIVNSDTLGKMKKTAFLVNTSRDMVVDQKALKFALEKKLIAGTGIDVYEDEPPKEIDFISLENLACSPNIGGNSEEGVLAMGRSAIGHLEDFFSP